MYHHPCLHYQIQVGNKVTVLYTFICIISNGTCLSIQFKYSQMSFSPIAGYTKLIECRLIPPYPLVTFEEIIYLILFRTTRLNHDHSLRITWADMSIESPPITRAL